MPCEKQKQINKQTPLTGFSIKLRDRNPDVIRDVFTLFPRDGKLHSFALFCAGFKTQHELFCKTINMKIHLPE